MSDDYNTAPEADSGPGVPAGLPVVPMTPTLPLTALVESLLFVADGPVTTSQLATALDVSTRGVEHALDELEAGYVERGLRIQRDKSGVQLTTAPQAAEAVEKFLGLESIQRLSRPAVETLAIIAYQQPVTRPYIESIRGVNCDGVIKSLLTKGLIEESGRTEGPGRPVLYSTTSTFLQHFGLASLTELPPLDIEALLAAARITDQGPAADSGSLEAAMLSDATAGEAQDSSGGAGPAAAVSPIEEATLAEAEAAGAQLEDAIEDETSAEAGLPAQPDEPTALAEEADGMTATESAVEAEAELVGADAEDALAADSGNRTVEDGGVVSARAAIAGEWEPLASDDAPEASRPAEFPGDATDDGEDDEDWDEEDDDDDDWEDEDGDNDAD